jgi:hypothetical protein
MKKEERLGCKETTKCGAKRQARILFQDNATTLGRINVECPLSNTGKEFLGLGAHRTA